VYPKNFWERDAMTYRAPINDMLLAL